MSPDKLVRMANQIATFFHSQPGADQAERVAGHLRDFWGPEMREALKGHAQSGHEKDLDVLVRRALPLI
ncbi:NAD-dependent formate dehydrogenase, delta subunit [Roseibacterium elongatum DSM 19469]|uniref:NAD-dependent formate dehydrogenase, delta subunit n=1 Tax=Roseicyclus elongatus DSM 19469 TaxID=1294273 RepID=W8RW25_9RHOB|nr:formate dehydrogenase subunit delta [Roseibacterium elongatum]AHM05488.1 NAD-dependent formate dehydrogenase, delta subunit [Roseibacterium elongatum DSM 19469]